MILYTVCDKNGNSYCGQAYDRKRDATKLLKALNEHGCSFPQYQGPWHIETEEDTTR